MNCRIPYKKELNPSQLEAVNFTQGPLLVIAGAGSGKTRTLIYRVARLVEEGILPGGGVALLRVLSALDKIKITGDAKIGVDIIRRAVIAPIKQIAENAGLDGSIVAQKVAESKERNFGYDAMQKKYGDMIKFGVIVPTKVERIALQNGASIASLLLTTDAIVSEIPEKKEAPAMPGGGGMY